MEIAFCVEWSETDPNMLIEELQANNRQMANEKNRYLTIFESHPHMVFIPDGENRVNNLNPSAAIQRTRWRASTLAGRRSGGLCQGKEHARQHGEEGVFRERRALL